MIRGVDATRERTEHSTLSALSRTGAFTPRSFAKEALFRAASFGFGAYARLFLEPVQFFQDEEVNEALSGEALVVVDHSSYFDMTAGPRAWALMRPRPSINVISRDDFINPNRHPFLSRTLNALLESLPVTLVSRTSTKGLTGEARKESREKNDRLFAQLRGGVSSNAIVIAPYGTTRQDGSLDPSLVKDGALRLSHYEGDDGELHRLSCIPASLSYDLMASDRKAPVLSTSFPFLRRMRAPVPFVRLGAPFQYQQRGAVRGDEDDRKAFKDDVISAFARTNVVTASQLLGTYVYNEVRSTGKGCSSLREPLRDVLAKRVDRAREAGLVLDCALLSDDGLTRRAACFENALCEQGYAERDSGIFFVYKRAVLRKPEKGENFKSVNPLAFMVRRAVTVGEHDPRYAEVLQAE